MSDTVEINSNEPAPMVAPDASYRLTSRRPGHELFPSSWLGCKATLSYHNGNETYDLRCTLLEFRSIGLVIVAGGGKSLISWTGSLPLNY